jgi:hypothetical protein
MPNNSEIKSTRTWQQIAAEASMEMDCEKLLVLAAELEHALEEHDKALHVPTEPSAEEAIEQKPTVRCDNPQA